MWGRVASSFPRCLYLPSVPTGYPFAAGWAVSERSVRASSRARAVDLLHLRHALYPLCYLAHCTNRPNKDMNNMCSFKFIFKNKQIEIDSIGLFFADISCLFAWKWAWRKTKIYGNDSGGSEIFLVPPLF